MIPDAWEIFTYCSLITEHDHSGSSNCIQTFCTAFELHLDNNPSYSTFAPASTSKVPRRCNKAANGASDGLQSISRRPESQSRIYESTLPNPDFDVRLRENSTKGSRVSYCRIYQGMTARHIWRSQQEAVWRVIHRSDHQGREKYTVGRLSSTVFPL